ncbi:HAD-IA family hydrolase [Candidatus Dependentiae bacterium]|nr:HAD-IA family hydrolase [Candidatus Dependentiae bacterium]
MIKKTYLLAALASAPLCEGKILLWDLGGVLVDASRIGIAHEVGLAKFIAHIIKDFRSPRRLQERLFQVIGYLEKPQKDLRAEAGDGMLLPVIMCQWQAGTITGKEIADRALVLIEKLDKKDFFDSSLEKKVIRETIKKMFDPILLAKHTHPIKKGYKLLEECMNVRLANGSIKNQSFIFSNYDKLGLEQLRKTKPELFTYFKGLIISGQLGLIKPYDEIFNYFIQTYKLNPSECILIDDQKVNTDAARKMGFKAILVERNNFKKVRKELIRLGAL